MKVAYIYVTAGYIAWVVGYICQTLHETVAYMFEKRKSRNKKYIYSILCFNFAYNIKRNVCKK